ncbi:hypothetical protein SAMN04515620_12664 [Collimonas sp. OK607]|uniref:hypothetical protein n=1 Tax=Collimonas sp. OK607 TaxID=1798194 RepID=UPI0008EA98A7|nr:hypothetical protein [Collimonas sp. OK607]SFB21465.1 hypothetical protein SAMN04515620_12664 [Collimonas sp. OK607]
MVANMALEGPHEQLQVIRDQQVARASTMTLVTLMGMFTGSYLSPSAQERVAAQVDDEAGRAHRSQCWLLRKML